MRPLIFAAFFLLSFSYGIEDLEMLGDDIGCYEHHTSNPGVPDLSLVINSTSAAQTVDKCLAECIQRYFRYVRKLHVLCTIYICLLRSNLFTIHTALVDKYLLQANPGHISTMVIVLLH